MVEKEYTLSKVAFDKKVRKYVDSVEVRTMANEGEYDFMIGVKDNGTIDCFPCGKEQVTVRGYFLPKDISTKLSELAKN